MVKYLCKIRKLLMMLCAVFSKWEQSLDNVHNNFMKFIKQKEVVLVLFWAGIGYIEQLFFRVVNI